MDLKGKAAGLNPQPSGGGGKSNIDFDDLIDVTCNECDNHTFEQVRVIKKLSKLMSPKGEEGIVPIPVFKCDECGNINDEFLDFSKNE